MLQIQAIRENTDKVIQALNKRGFKSEEIIPKILDLDASRREIQTELAPNNRDKDLHTANRILAIHISTKDKRTEGNISSNQGEKD